MAITPHPLTILFCTSTATRLPVDYSWMVEKVEAMSLQYDTKEASLLIKDFFRSSFCDILQRGGDIYEMLLTFSQRVGMYEYNYMNV